MRHRKGLSATDRSARSQLHKLLEQADGLIHGSLIRMSRRCGNPHCRCAVRDQKHESWYLGITRKGKTKMKHIPKEKEFVIRRWSRNYTQARQLLNKISDEAWKSVSGGEARKKC